MGKGLKQGSYKNGKKIATEINQYGQENGGVLMFFPDSMTVNTTEILNAFKETLTVRPLILGGTAGDMMKFEKTYQYFDGKVYTDTVTAVYITGNFEMDWLVSHGCEEIGLQQKVTKTDKNSVVEIDGEPAWESFRKYLPGDPDNFKAEDAFHLCLGELHDIVGEKESQLIIRMPVGLDAKTGAVNFSVEIPQNCSIHLTRRDPQIIAKKVLAAFKELLKKNQGKKVLAVFQYDCAGRGRVIYGNKLNEVLINPVQKLIGYEVPWIGFHTYGEIAPIGNQVFFHNFTAVISVMFAG